jgi:hypothetical protein
MLTLIRTPMPVVPYAAGKAPLVDLLRGVKTHKVSLHIQGNLVVSTAAAGNVGTDPYSNIFAQIRILEGGNARIDLSGPMLGYLTNRNRRQAASWTGLPASGASLAVATYPIAADFAIDMAQFTNAAGDPTETCFMDALPNVRTQLEITWTTTNFGIGTANYANISITGLTIQPTQLYDASAGQAPYFLPRVYRGVSNNFSAATTKFPIYVFPQGVNRVQAFIFRGVTASITDPTVWNVTAPGSFNFRGDRTKYWDSVEEYEIFDEFGQNFWSPIQSFNFLDLNFRRYGKLSECYIGGQDQNPRLEADVTSGSTSAIEWYSLELETVAGVTSPLPSNKS